MIADIILSAFNKTDILSKEDIVQLFTILKPREYPKIIIEVLKYHSYHNLLMINYIVTAYHALPVNERDEFIHQVEVYYTDNIISKILEHNNITRQFATFETYWKQITPEIPTANSLIIELLIAQGKKLEKDHQKLIELYNKFASQVSQKEQQKLRDYLNLV